jgi:hypothetical protein
VASKIIFHSLSSQSILPSIADRFPLTIIASVEHGFKYNVTQAPFAQSSG